MTQSIIGYLHDSPSRRFLFYDTFKEAISIWSSVASISNTSYEQQFHLTKCLVVFNAFLDDNDKNTIGSGKIF